MAWSSGYGAGGRQWKKLGHWVLEGYFGVHPFLSLSFLPSCREVSSFVYHSLSQTFHLTTGPQL